MLDYLLHPFRHAWELLGVLALVLVGALAVNAAAPAGLGAPVPIDLIAAGSILVAVAVLVALWPTLTATKPRTMLLMSTVLFLAMAGPAYAVAPDTPVADQIVTVDLALLSAAIGTFIPLVVAWITKQRASSTVKAVANFVLVLVGGAIAALIDAGGSLTVREIGSAVLLTFLTAGASYKHLWKPVGATGAIQNATPLSGLS